MGLQHSILRTSQLLLHPGPLMGSLHMTHRLCPLDRATKKAQCNGKKLTLTKIVMVGKREGDEVSSRPI